MKPLEQLLLNTTAPASLYKLQKLLSVGTEVQLPLRIKETLPPDDVQVCIDKVYDRSALSCFCLMNVCNSYEN